MKALPIICVFTGSRAEYGLMRTLIGKLAAEPRCRLELLISGSHLSVRHGLTKSEIIKDGMNPRHSITLSEAGSMAEHSAEVIRGCNQIFQRLSPSALIVLGDRYETFAAASCAYLMGIPIAHLHGGEITEGALDNGLRHAITHMAFWHFTAAYPCLDLVRQLGASPERSFCVGPMVLDALGKQENMDQDQFEAETGYRFAATNLLISYHSVTQSPSLGLSGFKALLEVLAERLQTDHSVNILFTYPNLDRGGTQIITLLDAFVQTHPKRCWVIPSLGQMLYLNALRLFTVLIGNSSSGILEAPLVGLPVVNIGERQQGRLRFGEVIDANSNQASIRASISLAISRAGWIAKPWDYTSHKNHIFPRGPCPSDQIIDTLLNDDMILRPLALHNHE